MEHNIFRAPPSLEPGLHGMVLNPRNLTPLRETLCNSVDGQSNVAAFVSHLCGDVSPSTVGKTVSLVWINSVDTVAYPRFDSHVSEKVLEMFPSIADSDPASSVVFPTITTWGVTSMPHPKPDSISRGIRHSMCPLPVGDCSLEETPTSFCLSPPNVVPLELFDSPTCTTCFQVSPGKQLRDRQLVERHAHFKFGSHTETVSGSKKIVKGRSN